MWYLALSHHWSVRCAHPVWRVCSGSHSRSWNFPLNYLFMFGLRKRNLKRSTGSWQAWVSDMFGTTPHSPQGRKSLVLKKKKKKKHVRNKCKIMSAAERCEISPTANNVLVLIWCDSRADPLSWERLWVCCFGVWCTSHQEHQFLSEDGGVEDQCSSLWMTDLIT